MNSVIKVLTRPTVQVVGDIYHADFADVLALIRGQAQLVETDAALPELIVVAQSRPCMIGQDRIELLRRQAPLAGMISLLGSWCEGETRTGRPWPGVERLYWHEFPGWWQRQLKFRAEGRCPDWARPANSGVSATVCGRHRKDRGLVILRVEHCEMACAIAEVVSSDGYATAWFRSRRTSAVMRGVAAGIWAGGQLNDREADDLSEFCRQVSRAGAPVIALLDFPRRDSVDRALSMGARCVLPQPWRNAEFLAELEALTTRRVDGLAA